MPSTSLTKWLNTFCLTFCVGLYCVHLYFVWKYAVDVPFMDEWASFEPGQLQDDLSFRGLFVQHNEHRLATTRLFIWVQYHLNGWNLILHQIFNFVVYGFILIVIGWLAKEITPELPCWLIASFLIFLLSPINWWNHFMGYQSQVHFWLLFYLLGGVLLFRETQRWPDLIMGSAAASVSTYSMAGGFVSSLVLIVVFSLFKVTGNQAQRPLLSARDVVQLILVLGVLGGTTLLWLIGYQKPAHHPALTLPYEWEFWSYFLNLVALGFGFDRKSTTVGVFCLLIVLAPLMGLIRIYGSKLPVRSWRGIALTVGVLAVLASVSTGRAGLGTEQAKASRYFEFAMSLVPLSLVNWSLFLQRKKLLRSIVVTSLWVFCFSGFANDWRDFRYYDREAVRRRIGLTCLEDYYEEKGSSNCPTIFPAPLPTHLLEEAKALNVSFYRSIASQSERGKRTSPFLHLRDSN